jgi:glucose/arabinose dehydrogenase
MSPKVSQPIDMDMPPGQPNMVYVTERTGALKRFDMSQENPMGTTLLEVTTSTTLECGFFGVAFHPNFDAVAEKRVYVSYTSSCATSLFGPAESALEEYELDEASATLKRSIFEQPQPQNNHNGGSIEFGPDGYLYFGLGDGGQGDDTGTGHSANGNGQDVSEPLGSILRFDVDAMDTPPAGNLTAADVGGESVDGRILHFGLRNPWRFTFDRETGDLYIGDVGQNTREEVNMLPAGSGPTNLGWAVREGKGAHTGGFTLVGGTTAMEPIYDYATDPGGGGNFKGSVTGGYVYRGQKIPGLYGRYVFADFVRGDITVITADGAGGVCDEGEIANNQITAQSLASFAEGSDGELYAIGLNDGIFRLDPAE